MAVIIIRVVWSERKYRRETVASIAGVGLFVVLGVCLVINHQDDPLGWYYSLVESTTVANAKQAVASRRAHGASQNNKESAKQSLERVFVDNVVVWNSVLGRGMIVVGWAVVVLGESSVCVANEAK